MGFYSKHVWPHVLDFAMRNKEVTRLRAAFVPEARGDVLEIGIGSGLNLPFYSSEVRRVYGVDPSAELQRMARGRAGDVPVEVEFLTQSAEEPLPLPSSGIDTVVLAWTLCSIPNPARALEQIKRVLKPSGLLVFAEHGRAPDPGVAAWQDRLTPVWKRLAGGCHLNRKVDRLVTDAGFRIARLSTFYIAGPRAVTYTYQGIARPA